MTKRVLVMCDGCGKEDLETNIRDWIVARFTVGRETEEVNLCSFSCVGRYGIRRAKEMGQEG